MLGKGRGWSPVLLRHPSSASQTPRTGQDPASEMEMNVAAMSGKPVVCGPGQSDRNAEPHPLTATSWERGVCRRAEWVAGRVLVLLLGELLGVGMALAQAL